MTCEEVRTHLSAFIDRAIARNTMSEVSAHLDHCGSCDELYRGLYEADQFYSSIRTQHVPDEYRESLRARLREALGDRSLVNQKGGRNNALSN